MKERSTVIQMHEIQPFQEGTTAGFLHTPEQGIGRGLVLTHGAGSNCQAPLLLAVAGAFVSAGLHVLRCDLPFRQRRRTGPPHPSQAAADRAGLEAAIEALGRVVGGRVFIGGHSYGGRQASMLAAENPSATGALLLLSYPLHPPDKPAQLRTAHFPKLRTPALFVQGTADPFGSIAEIENALELIPGPHHLCSVDGAAHDLRRGKFDVEGLAVRPFQALI